MSEPDWIKLLVKFKGKCQSCKKPVSTGEYALWSKSTKQIKHLDCKINKNNDTANEQVEKYSGLQLQCFLCKSVNNISISLVNEFLYDGSQENSIFLCKSCLENPTSYLSYNEIM
ncbi:MAG: hypothetical protein ACRD6Q_09440, partial [Nitrososphaeraceae archaeon]